MSENQKNNIREGIANTILVEVIHRVVENMRERLEECSTRDGDHLEEII